jgi:hypothetical protein
LIEVGGAFSFGELEEKENCFASNLYPQVKRSSRETIFYA